MKLSARCSCGVDAHAHGVPENFPDYIGGKVTAEWPAMAAAQGCHRNVMISGKVCRTVSDRCRDTGKRLEDLIGLNPGLQATSPMPQLLSYWLDPPDAQQPIRFHDRTPVERVQAAGFDDATFDALIHRNARGFLGLEKEAM